jgi:hypothetical protein
MIDQNELYRVEGLPIFQNRMYPTRGAARDCARGDVVLVEDLQTGLVYNRAFNPDVMQYDSNYQKSSWRREGQTVAATLPRMRGTTHVSPASISARPSASPEMD